MPAITDYINARCKGLASLQTSDPISFNVYLSDAQNRTNQAWFGGNYALAVALRMMHNWTLDNRFSGNPNGVGGAVTSEREGGTSVSFETSKGDQKDDDLPQTYYGKQLKALIRNSGAGVSVVGFNNVAAAGVPTLGAAAGMISDDETGDEGY